MQKLGLFLLISFTVHVLILLIPLPEKTMEKSKAVEVSIVEKQVKKPKPKELEKNRQKPVKKETAQKQPEKKQPVKKEPVKKETVKKEQEKVAKNNAVKVDNSKKADNKPVADSADKGKTAGKAESENKDYKPKGADDPLVLPDINVPLANTEQEPEIAVPDIPNITESKKESSSSAGSGGSNSGLASDVQKEIAALNENRAEENAKENNTANADNVKVNNDSNLYKFDIAPSKGSRRLAYAPPEPEFSLSNDTSVTLRFDIDSQGNTYNISFVTRSSSEIEAIAYGYVKKMKFDAVLDNRKDFAQITLFFKVRQ